MKQMPTADGMLAPHDISTHLLQSVVELCSGVSCLFPVALRLLVSVSHELSVRCVPLVAVSVSIERP